MENYYTDREAREEKAVKEAMEAWSELLKATDRGLTAGERKAINLHKEA